MSLPDLAFLHNPKAGGTSIASAISSLYDPTDIAPVFDNSPQDRDPNRWHELKKYRFVSGHFGYEVQRSVLPKHRLITNFRQPVDRIHSMYAYWRRSFDPETTTKYLPEENGPKYAHIMSFSDFVRSKTSFLSLYLDNFHTRQILHSGWLPRTISPLDIFVAKRRIKNMLWFYICERETESAAWLTSIFPKIEALPRANATDYDNGDVSLPTEEDRAVILARNSADLALYQYAVKRLEKMARKDFSPEI